MTKLLYLEDFNVTTCKAQVVNQKETEDSRRAIILDQTCFYPRGGGQDWDTGKIVGETEFVVEEVRLDPDGVVWHIGSGSLNEGEKVECVVDAKRREKNSKLHSAGHALDMATSEIFPDWIPGKGAHYPHMSFVEYEGGVENPEEAAKQIETKIAELQAKNPENTLQFMSKDELAKVCRHVPDYIPDNKPTRVVLYGTFGVPCGGTHVKRIADIGKITITKVKSKKGIIKVSYAVEGIN